MTHEEQITQARAATSSAIADVARTRWELEQRRKDRTCDPALISDAAREYRSAEEKMKGAVEQEVQLLIKIVLERARGLDQGAESGNALAGNAIA